MTIQAQLPDGTVLEFPDGTDPQVIQATVKRTLGVQEQPVQQPVQQQELTIPERVLGGLETAATVGSSLVAEPIAGLAGLAAAANPFNEPGAGAARVEQVREALTIQPQTTSGQQGVGRLASTLEPVANALNAIREEVGDQAFDATQNPALATFATILPDLALELAGGGIATRSARRGAQAPAVSQAQRASRAGVEAAEQSTGIRQLTSDVLPPETRIGRFMQQQGELIEGGQRQAQQAERVRAVDKLLESFNVSDGANFEAGIVQGVRNSIDAKKAEAGALFEQSTKQLDQLGSVPLSNSKNFAQNIIERETAKGTLGDQALIADMQSIVDAPDTLTFEMVKEIRSSVGSKLQAAQQGAPVQGSSDVGRLKQVYKQLSRDMEDFANATNPELAAQWKNADKVFSDFATGANKTGVKSLIKQGNATPEVVNQLLFSNKNSDIEFLAKNLDEAGKTAAKQRILQRAFQVSSPDGIEINPNRFQAQLNKMRNQVGKLFSPEERKAVFALRDTLQQTRRAQEAAVTSPTGQQLVPLFAVTNPQVLIPGVAQAIIERPTMRNLIIRRKAAKTARQRSSIDQQLQNEINQSGLLGAATAGAVSAQAQEQ